ncbi:MAG: hypothetical protein KBS52_03935 [Clostridiales bacterium]|nr:hypothetical protein [Candidatus Equinaster intestinalis]
MDNKKSKTLEQQRKARRDFLELKKMQSGEIAPPPKPSEEEALPKTFGEKVKNFWFHYKVQTIAVVCLVIVLAIGISSCLARPDYDARVVIYTNSYFTQTGLYVFEDYIKQYATDVNGDGEINVQIVDCSYNKDGTYDSDYVSSLASKLQALIASEGEVQLFIVDDIKREQLENISENIEHFFVDEAKVDDSLYKIAEEKGEKIPENLTIGRRVVKGTLIENVKNIEEYTKNATEILEKIKG